MIPLVPKAIPLSPSVHNAAPEGQTQGPSVHNTAPVGQTQGPSVHNAAPVGQNQGPSVDIWVRLRAPVCIMQPLRVRIMTFAT